MVAWHKSTRLPCFLLRSKLNIYLLKIPSMCQQWSWAHDMMTNQTYWSQTSSPGARRQESKKTKLLTESTWRGFSPVRKIKGALWKSHTWCIRKEKKKVLKRMEEICYRQPMYYKPGWQGAPKKGNSQCSHLILVVDYKLWRNSL